MIEFFTEVLLATIGAILMTIGCLVQIVYLFKDPRDQDPFSHYLILAGAVGMLAHTIERSIKIQFVAVTNTFESLIFFAAAIGIVVFVYRMIAKDKTIKFIPFGATIIALALLAVASSPLASREIKPPIPALQSSWLVLHVTCAFIGEALFAVAFIVAIMYFCTREEEKKKRLDRIMYTAIIIGYPIFTAGALIFGAIWAEIAWGRYWSWDPKETWALITWLTYTAYLHTRFIKKMRGAVSAILSIIGFLFTLFTFFGVNYLLSGLHSYG